MDAFWLSEADHCIGVGSSFVMWPLVQATGTINSQVATSGLPYGDDTGCHGIVAALRMSGWGLRDGWVGQLTQPCVRRRLEVVAAYGASCLGR